MSGLPPRSPADWRAYDRANLWIIGGLLACCALLAVLTRTLPPAPAPALRPADSGGAPLEFYAARGWVRLSGAVPDAGARELLLRSAGQAFGDDRVIDQLATRPDAAPLPWLGRASDVFAGLATSTEPSGVRIDGGTVTLSGTVPKAFMVAGRESQARQWFGAGVRIDNRLEAREPAEAAAFSAAAMAAAAAPLPGEAASAAAAPAEGTAATASGSSNAPTAPTATTAPATTTASTAPTTPPASAAAADTALCAELGRGIAIAFQPGLPQLAPAGRVQLAEVARCLGSGRWRVGGHTDANGPEDRNLALTRQRAEAVVAQLVKLGVARERLSAEGLGSSRPIADNTSREGRILNRRITFEPAG